MSLDHEMSIIPLHAACNEMQNSSTSATKDSYSFPKTFTHVNINLSQVALTLYDDKGKFIVTVAEMAAELSATMFAGRYVLKALFTSYTDYNRKNSS